MRPLLAIFLIVAVDVLGLTIILPLLPFYAEKFGASPAQVGLLAATFAVFQLVSGPFLGQLSDRFGRKPLLLVSQVGTLAGFLILARADALWLVFLSRIIDGATAGNLSLAQAYISDVTAPKDRAKSFAIIGIAFGLGFLVGPAISGFLSQYGYHYPPLLAAALSLTSILSTALFLDSHPKRPEGLPPEAPRAAPGGERLSLLSWGAYAQYFRRPGLANLLIQFFLFAFAFATFTSGFALFAERRLTWDGKPFGPREVGYVFAYAGLLGVILQGGLIGGLVRRFGEQRLAVVAFASTAVAYLGLGLTQSVEMLLVVATLSAFGTGVLRPALTSLISQSVGPREQGVVLGLNQSLNSVAQIAAPLLGGWLIGLRMLTAWAVVASIAAGAGLWLARGARSRVLRESRSPAS